MKSLEEYKQMVEDVIKHSQEYPFDLNCSDIIEVWYNNKKPFIDMFKGETCFESGEVSFELSQPEKESCFIDFVDALYESLLCGPSFTYMDVPLYTFLSENRGSFFDNKVTVIPEELKHQKQIRVGDRLIRSLKFFYDNKEELKAAQNIASQYIQKNVIKGKLYLSVDPLDFLLASENNESWRSCHALDGDYRSGNLSYMLDCTTVIAFISNGDRQHMRMLPSHITAFSKKLRVFTHWEPKGAVLYFSKTYPFDVPQFRKHIVETINSLLPYEQLMFEAPFPAGFRQTQIHGLNRHLHENYLYAFNSIFRARDVVHEPPCELILHYNDIIKSSSYEPYLSTRQWTWWLKNNLTSGETLQINVGHSVPCARGCGNLLGNSNSFICSNCEEELGMCGDYFLHCCDCGKRIWDTKEAYECEDGTIQCKRCFVG